MVGQIHGHIGLRARHGETETFGPFQRVAGFWRQGRHRLADADDVAFRARQDSARTGTPAVGDGR